MKVAQYDKILLKDGRTATVVEVLGDYEEYIADIDLDGDYDTQTISPEQIEKIIKD